MEPFKSGKPFATILVSIAMCAAVPFNRVAAQAISVSKTRVALSAIKGSSSRPDTIVITASKGDVRTKRLRLEGDGALHFGVSIVPSSNADHKAVRIAVIFKPDINFIGIAHAIIRMPGVGEPILLTGLSTRALEGENEPPLSTVLQALDIQTDIGWQTLGHHTRRDQQGSELEPSLFTIAEDGPVTMVPVARYSPDFPLTFGYYTPSPLGPVQEHVGILASKTEGYPAHQTLHPSLAQGSTQFSPKGKLFGFYAISPDHTVYSEDTWNILFHPDHVNHAMRIFPVTQLEGQPVLNTYLVCMEEAKNGDYNDYVFLVSNIKPVTIAGLFQSLYNGKDFTGWYVWLQGKGRNNDPEQIFTVMSDGTIHDEGKELGYLMSEKSFINFHFSLEFKWGERRHPPRESAKRDSGICYNIPDDEPDHIWPKSIECQIQEGDVGDFWLLGYSTIQVDGKQNQPLPYSRIQKDGDGEKPNGEWNTVEVISFNGKCAHLVNGQLVNIGDNASLIGGRILLQSEYAEVSFRNIKIREFGN